MARKTKKIKQKTGHYSIKFYLLTGIVILVHTLEKIGDSVLFVLSFLLRLRISIKLPKVSLPKVNLPKVTFPKFSILPHIKKVAIYALYYLLRSLIAIGDVAQIVGKRVFIKSRKILKAVDRVVARVLYIFLRIVFYIARLCTSVFKSGFIFAWQRKIFPIIFALIIGYFLLLQANAFLLTVPNPTNISDFQLPAAVMIYDKHNTLLYSAYENTYRIPVPLSKVPKTLIDATIAAEDKRFYEHTGFDKIALARTVFNNLTHKNIIGGSTISQQLAKNAFLTNEKTLQRKVKEVIIATRIERNFTKDQILELYFNTISYGGVANGVEAASQKYFGKHVQDLTEKQAIFLASLPVAPSVFSKIEGTTLSYPTRIDYVLDRMYATGKITKEKEAQIKKQPLVFSPQISYKRAPHAVDYVLSELEKTYGKQALYKSGLKVYTSIDLPLQNYIQETVLDNINLYRGQNLTNAAVIVTSPRDGTILAMVGSANYYDPDGGQFNVAVAKRQLGSTLKVLTYAQAFESGMNPSSTIVDGPTKFPLFPDYSPRNYDGKFHGTVSLRQAFANSYNIPALKLADKVGIQNVADLGVRMGITEFSQFSGGTIPVPLSLAIGGVEITLEHLANAYSVVANDGNAVKLSPILKVTDYQDHVLFAKKDTSKNTQRVISQKTAEDIYAVLSDKSARAAAFGAPAFFDFGNAKVAIKTGTSNDIKDNVAVAFSKDFVVSVWVGNNDSTPMYGVLSGYLGASEIMHKTTLQVLSSFPNKDKTLSINAKNN